MGKQKKSTIKYQKKEARASKLGKAPAHGGGRKKPKPNKNDKNRDLDDSDIESEDRALKYHVCQYHDIRVFTANDHHRSSLSQPRRNHVNDLWVQFLAFILETKRSILTLSKAPDTFEQYTAIFIPCASGEIQLRISVARASRAPLPTV